MGKIDNNLSDIFDIEVKSTTTSPNAVIVAEEIDDSTLVRENLFKLLQTGNTMLEEIKTLATDTEDPKAYDSFSNLLSKLSMINQNIFSNCNLKIKSATANKNEEAVPVTNNTQNNILFSGSTAELNNFIKSLQKS